MRARAERNGYKNGTKFGSLTSQIKYDPRVAMQLNIDMLPTPLTRDYKGGTTAIRKDTGKVRTDALDSCVKYMMENDLLPTPLAVEVHHQARTQRAIDQGQTTFRGRPDEGKDTHPSGLMDYLQFYGILPTPITSDSQGGARKIEANGRTLRGSSGENFSASLKDIMITRSESGGVTSRLSPLFTEEMMGFPLMWTALPFLSENGEPKPSKPTATPSVRR